jgi:hypothetical protein
MSFIHGYLLAGLLLVGVPILLHLIMRQKPKQLLFPAFRFLRQKALINKRKMRLQNWLLLALRMLLIAVICFALARPRLASSRVPFGSEQAVAAAFIFDTSASMEYTVGDRTTRLDDAKRRATQILDELSPSSQIAVFDSGDDSADEADPWLTSGQLRSRIDGLRIRAANAPVNRQVERATRLLLGLGEGENVPPRFLFIFSDRTRESWDTTRKMQPVEGINTVYVDVGVDKPKDWSIDKIEIEPAVVSPEEKITIRATVRSTGGELENELTCQFDPEPSGLLPYQRPVAFSKDGPFSGTFAFDRTAPTIPAGVKQMAVHVIVKLLQHDALPSNNMRYATFMVRNRRPVLTVVDNDWPHLPKGDRWRNQVELWKRTIEVAPGGFHCDVKTVEEAEKLSEKELAAYAATWLFEVRRPSAALWDHLTQYVKNGSGLAIVPGGNEMLQKVDDTTKAVDEFNKGAGKLLPANLVRIITVPHNQPVGWDGYSGQHPITAYFREESRTSTPDFLDPHKLPVVYGYWQVKPADDATVIASYTDKDKHAAFVERQFEKGKGRVLLFTTPFLPREELGPNRPWNSYWGDVSFGLILTDRTNLYLAGEAARDSVNYLCGQVVTAPMPPAPFAPPFTLQGPGLAESETAIPTPDSSPSLALTQTLGPGNFTILDGKNNAAAGFSMNIRSEEFDLTRLPVDVIEASLGKDTVLAPERSLDLSELLHKRWAPPVELLPYLMMFLLLALTVESLLANFFYRRQTPAAPEPEPEGVAA